ncbi:MAG TPA: ABC transporter permease subunit, partial [Solibacillus sp.]
MLKPTMLMRGLSIIWLVIFIFFLALPLGAVVVKSFEGVGGWTLHNYEQALTSGKFKEAFFNSVWVSTIAAVITTVLAFLLAYTVHFTNVAKPIKKFIRLGVTLPMLLPTITYGFVLIYAFGNQGIFSRLFGQPLFTIYGFNGLVIGYVLYTLPAAFLLMHNAMQYMDHRFIIVSHLMGDGKWRRFYHTILRPMLSPIGGAFILAFILSFTDYGIPASVGGTYDVIATTLYQTMLGSIPNFSQGAVISMAMLAPAVLGMIMMGILERGNVSYKSLSQQVAFASTTKTVLFGSGSVIVVLALIAVFTPLIIVPFTTAYPFDFDFTLAHFQAVIQMPELMNVYRNSLLVAIGTALVGVVLAFVAGLLSARTKLKSRQAFDVMAMITNAVPGMVLGLGYLFFFNNSSLKGTFFIIIAYTIIHFFTTPFLMVKNALQKMDPSWEVTGALLRDSWLKTIYRIILPNVKKTLIEVFS